VFLAHEKYIYKEIFMFNGKKRKKKVIIRDKIVQDFLLGLILPNVFTTSLQRDSEKSKNSVG